MRKTILLIFILPLFYFSNAQTVSQLWAPVREGGGGLNYMPGALKSMATNGSNIKTYLPFDSAGSAAFPIYGELTEYNGNFYGMSSRGGGLDTGVIFQWSPTTNVLLSKVQFDVQKGTFPANSLTLVNDKFYGLANNNSTGNVLFEWDPLNNIYAIKSNFNSTSGTNLNGNLSHYNNKLFGMASQGGSNNVGTIFEYDIASTTFTKKYDFVTATGAGPYGSLALLGAKFYGVTRNGGPSNVGSIFEWDPATNIYTPKYYFDNSNGALPYGEMVYYNNMFYGITYQGGANNAGVIFEWDPINNIYTKKIDMAVASGRYSTSKLKLMGNKFYGLTSSGGANAVGVIFEWDPATNIYTKKVDLTTADGANPNGSMTVWGTKFAGMTTSGGNNGIGAIFEWDPGTNIYTKKFDFYASNTINGANPLNSLTFYNGKLYGTTSLGGINNAGTIYEYDPQTKTHTKNYDFNNTNGTTPISKLTLKDGKFYGTTLSGGVNNAGVLYEWDPVTNTFTKKYDFVVANGQTPSADLVELNGKFYATTRVGGASGLGVIYEWDPLTNIYTKKVDLTAATGSQPNGSFVYYNNLLYGMTMSGGANNVGAIFQWDPVTNVFTKRFDMAVATGSAPRGTLTLYNNKFYGLTRDGGANNQGALFEWDPSSNGYTKKHDFSNATGISPQGSLTLSNSKFYGMTSIGGGVNIGGSIFEWDPATNNFTVKQSFATPDVGWRPSFENNFITIPAPIAQGTPNACTSVPSITIDASNNNTWVPIVDNDGNVLAEIDANGNNLGLITTSFYINSGTVREDANHTLYLDRNFTITPQNQPSTPVDIRLYMTEAEFIALQNAVNSLGQPSGINTITDVLIFKNSDACLPAVSGVLNAVPINGGVSYNGFGYMLTASINSFSSFYLLTPPAALPIHFVEFSGQLINNDVKLKWKALTSSDVRSFVVERSTNARDYSSIGSVTSINSGNTESYDFTDADAAIIGSPVLYYRLAERSIAGSKDYSRIITIPVNKRNVGISVYPNPINDQSTLRFSIVRSQNVSWSISDFAGKLVSKGAGNFSAGICFIPLSVSNFSSGVYVVKVQGETINEEVKIIKK